METWINLFVFVHLLGMAALVGGSLAQVREKSKSVTPLMRDGALTQLATGIILVGLVKANSEAINNTVVGLKTTLIIAILVLLWLGRKQLSNAYYFAIIALSIINVGLALFVTSVAQA